MSNAARRESGRELSWTAALALRYLKSGRKDAFVSFLSAVAMGGIGLGVAALILALSALNGLQEALRGEVLSRTSEIEIVAGSDNEPEELLPRVLGVPGVEAARLHVRGAGWALAGGSASPVEILGYEGTLPVRFPGAEGASAGLYVSDRFARIRGLQPGDTIEIASARSALSPLGPVPRMRRVELAGTFDRGTLEQRERIALPLDVAIDLLGRGGLGIVVEAGGLEGAVAAAPRIEAILDQGSKLYTWQDLNAPLLFALRLEKRLMFVAVALIVLVGALALISDLSLIIASRRPEIAILSTIGASSSDLRRVFLLLGLCLASLGVAAGTLLGSGLSWILDRFEILRLPSDVYLLNHIPFRIGAVDVAVVVLFTLLTTLACSWFGASKAAALEPVEALSS